MSESDPPIIIVGGPQMISVELRPPSRSQAPPEKFSVKPDDPAVPFKEIVVTEGATEVFRWPLAEEWKITIV